MKPPKILHKLMETGRNYSFPKQTWRRSGSCPQGTIPIRRIPTGPGNEIANRTDPPFFSYGRPSPAVTNEKFQANGKLEVRARMIITGIMLLPFEGWKYFIHMLGCR